MDNHEIEISQMSFFLAKPGNDFESVIVGAKELKGNLAFSQHDFKVDGSKCRFMYFETSTTKNNPKWLDFINIQIDKNQPKFSGTARSPNGILLTHINDRVLLTTFGRASISYVLRLNLESDFGIRTSMNMCGNEEIRQTKSQNSSITTTQIDRQVSKPSDTFAFGLSESEDLKYISARMKGSPNITLQGRDRLTVKITEKDRLTWDNIITKCTEFLVAYEKEDFKKLFPNYKNFAPATEEDVKKLDVILMDVLKAKDTERLQLCIPEFVQDDDFCFTYTNKKKQDNIVYPHLDVVQLYHHLQLSKLTSNYLKNKDIFAYSLEEDQVLSYKKWSIYSCLLFETELDDRFFILSDGAWREVEKDFYKSIIEFTNNQITVTDCVSNCLNIAINDDKKMQNREEIFNNEACNRNPSWVKFDQARLRIGSGRSDKEFCDILAMLDEEFVDIIHCKPLKNSTSINYLFSQAKFYGDAFLQDEEFLKQIRAHIEKSECTKKQKYLDHIGDDIEAIYGQDYQIRLWLLYDNAKSAPTVDDIPLIAKYELMLMHDHLRRVSKFHKVLLSFVPVKRVNYQSAKKPKAA